MDQVIGNVGKQGWNGSGSDTQNTGNFQKISQTDKLNLHKERKKAEISRILWEKSEL